MWHKNLMVYRLGQLGLTAEQLAEALRAQAFNECGAMDTFSMGWIPPREGGDLVHACEGQFLLKLATETKSVPQSAVNRIAKERAKELEEQQGFPPGRKAMKELKERIVDEKLPSVLPALRTTSVWIDTKAGWLVVDAASPARADDVIKMLLRAVDRLPVENLRVQIAPATAMSHWLSADEAPQGFTVDQDLELRATGESKATVRYTRHSIEPDDVRRHIDGGKQVTKMALTWADRVSFVLTDTLAVKRITPLDVLKESNTAIRDDVERFDADFLLMAGELSRLLADLVAALGGEMTTPAPADPQRAPTGVAAAAKANYDEAVAILRKADKVSISHLQRMMRLGYNQAANLIEQMVANGIVTNNSTGYIFTPTTEQPA